MLVEDTDNWIWKYIVAETFLYFLNTFLSVQNKNVACLISNRELQKKRKSSKIIIDRIGKFYCNINNMD